MECFIPWHLVIYPSELNDGNFFDSIAEKVGINCNSVFFCHEKFKAGSIESAILNAPAVDAVPKSRVKRNHGLSVLHVRNL